MIHTQSPISEYSGPYATVRLYYNTPTPPPTPPQPNKQTNPNANTVAGKQRHAPLPSRDAARHGDLVEKTLFANAWRCEIKLCVQNTMPNTKHQHRDTVPLNFPQTRSDYITHLRCTCKACSAYPLPRSSVYGTPYVQVCSSPSSSWGLGFGVSDLGECRGLVATSKMRSC